MKYSTLTYCLLTMCQFNLKATEAQTDSLPFHNPAFNKCPLIEATLGLKTVNQLDIHNGDLILVAWEGKFSNMVRGVIGMAGHRNPLALSHAAVAIVAPPRDILRIIDQKSSGEIESAYPISPYVFKCMRSKITESFNDEEIDRPQLLVFEADDLYGMNRACTQIGPLSDLVNSTGGGGNVFLRNIRSPWPSSYGLTVIERFLGAPYPSFFTPESLILSAWGSSSDSSDLHFFCSSVVARCYGIRDAHNVLPSQLSSLSGELPGFQRNFGKEIPLALVCNFSSAQASGRTVLGNLTKLLVNHGVFPAIR